MTISIKEQVPTISAAIRLMVAGLREIPNEEFVVRMSTFGATGTREGSDKRICYGCAATCAIQKLAGKRLDSDVIKYYDSRARELGFDHGELSTFETVIDELRQGLISYRVQAFFGLTREQFHKTRMIKGLLPLLNNNFTEFNLEQYERAATRLEAEGF